MHLFVWVGETIVYDLVCERRIRMHVQCIDLEKNLNIEYWVVRGRGDDIAMKISGKNVENNFCWWKLYSFMFANTFLFKIEEFFCEGVKIRLSKWLLSFHQRHGCLMHKHNSFNRFGWPSQFSRSLSIKIHTRSLYPSNYNSPPNIYLHFTRSLLFSSIYTFVISLPTSDPETWREQYTHIVYNFLYLAKSS